MNLVKILINTPSGIVLTSKWLKQQGISKDLLKVYRKNGLIKSIARGAFIKAYDIPPIEGAIYALQRDGFSVYIGGTSSLRQYHNIWQYLRQKEKTTLFSTKRETLPQWFRSAFADDYIYCSTALFNTSDGFQSFANGLGYSVKGSCIERAYLELLYMCPEYISVQEAYEILELMVTIKPKLLQNLLENCTSIKVKRLFLYLASNLENDWYKKLDLSKIGLGTSTYKISKNGKYIKEFNIVVDEVKNA